MLNCMCIIRLGSFHNIHHDKIVENEKALARSKSLNWHQQLLNVAVPGVLCCQEKKKRKKKKQRGQKSSLENQSLIICHDLESPRMLSLFITE